MGLGPAGVSKLLDAGHQNPWMQARLGPAHHIFDILGPVSLLAIFRSARPGPDHRLMTSPEKNEKYWYTIPELQKYF